MLFSQISQSHDFMNDAIGISQLNPRWDLFSAKISLHPWSACSFVLRLFSLTNVLMSYFEWHEAVYIKWNSNERITLVMLSRSHRTTEHCVSKSLSCPEQLKSMEFDPLTKKRLGPRHLNKWLFLPPFSFCFSVLLSIRSKLKGSEFKIVQRSAEPL